MTPQRDELAMTTKPLAVLFVCVRNGGTSQTAPAPVRHHAADAVHLDMPKTGVCATGR